MNVDIGNDDLLVKTHVSGGDTSMINFGVQDSTN